MVEARSAGSREAAASLRTPANCAEAGVGTAVLLGARRQELEGAAQPRATGGERCAGSDWGKLTFLKINLNIMQALAFHLVKLH